MVFSLGFWGTVKVAKRIDNWYNRETFGLEFKSGLTELLIQKNLVKSCYSISKLNQVLYKISTKRFVYFSGKMANNQSNKNLVKCLSLKTKHWLVC